jgi:hypothetical protein
VSGQSRALRTPPFRANTLNLSLIGYPSSLMPRMCGPDVDQALNRLINIVTFEQTAVHVLGGSLGYTSVARPAARRAAALTGLSLAAHATSQ